MKDKKFEWRDENEIEWATIDDEYSSFRTRREAAQYIIDRWYMSEGEHDHKYKIFVRDVETKEEKPYTFSFRLVTEFW